MTTCTSCGAPLSPLRDTCAHCGTERIRNLRDQDVASGMDAMLAMLKLPEIKALRDQAAAEHGNAAANLVSATSWLVASELEQKTASVLRARNDRGTAVAIAFVPAASAGMVLAGMVPPLSGLPEVLVIIVLVWLFHVPIFYIINGGSEEDLRRKYGHSIFAAKSQIEESRETMKRCASLVAKLEDEIAALTIKAGL